MYFALSLALKFTWMLGATSKMAMSAIFPNLNCLSSCPAPKIVFHRLNGKRHHPSVTKAAPREGFTPAHEENVNFVLGGMWTTMCELPVALD